jgi:hypothetical protein
MLILSTVHPYPAECLAGIRQYQLSAMGNHFKVLSDRISFNMKSYWILHVVSDSQIKAMICFIGEYTATTNVAYYTLQPGLYTAYIEYFIKVYIYTH